MSTTFITVLKVTIKLERGNWKLVVLKMPEGGKEPVLAFRGKYDSLDDALDGFADWRRGIVIV